MPTCDKIPEWGFWELTHGSRKGSAWTKAREISTMGVFFKWERYATPVDILVNLYVLKHFSCFGFLKIHGGEMKLSKKSSDITEG